ncbi:MAG: hypothetical protein ACP5VE_10635 [Chthonomonadales bacterium]
MPAFTYDLSNSIGKTRLYAGDIDPEALTRTGGDRTRTDAEIEALLLENGGDTRLAAAALLEGKAAEFASQALFVQQGSLSQDLRERSRQLRDIAATLRAVAGLPVWSPASSPDVFPEP